MDFQVVHPPPANPAPGDLLITMVKEAVILYKKKCFEKWEKVLSLIDLKVMKTRNDWETACDCVKRANVVLHVGLCKEIFARKHTATHQPTSAQPLTATRVTSNYRLWSPQGLRPSGATNSVWWIDAQDSKYTFALFLATQSFTARPILRHIVRVSMPIQSDQQLTS